MPNVIGLVGFPGAGKDTVAQQLVSRGDWRRVAFADALKDAFLLARPGESREELEDWKRDSADARRALQDFGMYFRTIDPLIWVRAAGLTIDSYLDSGFNVIVTDIRFPNEADLVREKSGRVVHLRREGHGPVNGHISEKNTADIIEGADWTLDNVDDGADMSDRLLSWMAPRPYDVALSEVLDQLFEEVDRC